MWVEDTGWRGLWATEATAPAVAPENDRDGDSAVAMFCPFRWKAPFIAVELLVGDEEEGGLRSRYEA